MTDCNQGMDNIGHLKYNSLLIKAILIIILLLKLHHLKYQKHLHNGSVI